MRSLRAALVIVFLLAVSSRANATPWSLGANMGFAAINQETGPDIKAFGWPSTVVAFQPGLRLGVLPGNGTHEVYLDTGLLSLSGGGSRNTEIQASGNYQVNFLPGARTQPYLTAGVGLIHASFASDFGGDESATSAMFGGGGGVRQWIASDSGSLRFELRYDRVTEGGDGFIEKAGVFGARMGFDLWIK
jgi:hypothetical protein